MKTLACAAFGCVAFSMTALTSGASAMPVAQLQSTSRDVAAAPQSVRWVCGPYRCWWRPNWYGPRWYGAYGYGGYGPRWHRWGRHW